MSHQTIWTALVSQPATFGRRLGKLAIFMAGALIVIGLSLTLPTLTWAGREGLIAMAIAQAIALLSNLAGAVPAVWGLSRGDATDHRNLLGGMLVRIVVLGLLILPAWLSGILPTKPLLLWLAGSYFVALMIETAMVATWIQQATQVKQ